MPSGPSARARKPPITAVGREERAEVSRPLPKQRRREKDEGQQDDRFADVVRGPHRTNPLPTG
jgi:hypothetical protein